MGFGDSVAANAARVLTEINKKISNSVEDLFTSVVEHSVMPLGPGPYATGLLANQWYPMVGGHSSEISESRNLSGTESLSRIKAMLATGVFLGKDAVITLTNNVDHAYRAEVLGWPAGQGANGWVWSGRQGPYAMIGRATQIWRARYI